MSKLTMTMFLTLDGVMQAPGQPGEDRSGGFQHGGWMVPHVDGTFVEFINDVISRADAFLLGRTTYEIFAGHWPRVTDPGDRIAAALNTLPKYVASRSLNEVSWANASLIRKPMQEVPELKRRYEREVQVHGSCGLTQTLMQHHLIDECNLLTFPVILGSGKRLFASGTVPTAFELTATKVTEKGVVIATYRRAGAPQYGSFALDA